MYSLRWLCIVYYYLCPKVPGRPSYRYIRNIPLGDNGLVSCNLILIDFGRFSQLTTTNVRRRNAKMTSWEGTLPTHDWGRKSVWTWLELPKASLLQGSCVEFKHLPEWKKPCSADAEDYIYSPKQTTVTGEIYAVWNTLSCESCGSNHLVSGLTQARLCSIVPSKSRSLTRNIQDRKQPSKTILRKIHIGFYK